MTSVATIMGALPIALGPRRRRHEPAPARLRHRRRRLLLHHPHTVSGAIGVALLRGNAQAQGSSPAHRGCRAGDGWGGRVIALAAALLLQVPIPVRIVPADSTLPHVTLTEAIRLATGVDPAYVRAAGQVDNAEWGRRAAVLAFIIPSLAVSLDATRYSTAFFNIGIGAPTSNAVNFRANAIYELISVRKITDLGFTKAELEASQANAERAAVPDGVRYRERLPQRAGEPGADARRAQPARARAGAVHGGARARPFRRGRADGLAAAGARADPGPARGAAPGPRAQGGAAAARPADRPLRRGRCAGHRFHAAARPGLHRRAADPARAGPGAAVPGGAGAGALRLVRAQGTEGRLPADVQPDRRLHRV